jgi:hypothetical protein
LHPFDGHAIAAIPIDKFDRLKRDAVIALRLNLAEGQRIATLFRRFLQRLEKSLRFEG